MISALVLSFGKTKTAKDNYLLADAIRSSVFERAALRDEYLFYREKDAKSRWTAKTAAADRLIQQAAAGSNNKESQAIAEEMQNSFNDTVDIFARIVGNSEAMKRADTNNPAH